MRELYLICHDDHLTSGSVRFLKDIFSREFNTHVIPYDGGISYVELLHTSNPRAVFVLLQTDFLVPWLCALGAKVVVMPMFDACARAPLSYFRVLDNGYLFSFSHDLHDKCIKAGIVSYKLNYFPDVGKKSGPRPKEERLFYWRRRPLSVLMERNVKNFFAPYIEHFHIHDRADAYRPTEAGTILPDGLTSVSNWFDEKSELTGLIGSSKYYLAPRQSEGIGMAFLEAMSAGCIVFANRNSTHNQYIYHGRNGFLIDFESEDENRIRGEIKEAFDIIRSGVPIGENARKFIADGAPKWKAQGEQMLRMVVALSEAEQPAPYSRWEQILGYVMAASYYKLPRIYFPFTRITAWVGSFSPRVGPRRFWLRLPLIALKKLKKKLTGRKYE